jgi:type I restriction enzyme S subunit
MELMLTLQQQNLILRRTRDLLLPRLVSGEIDVADLDIAVPEGTSA